MPLSLVVEPEITSTSSPQRKPTTRFRELYFHRLHIRVAVFGTKGPTKRTHTHGVAKSHQRESQVPGQCISLTPTVDQLDYR